MFFKLFIVFALIPMIELALLIKIGSIIGTQYTILIVILTAVIGAYMVKLEGLGIVYRIQKNMNEGVFPGEELIDGMMVLVAGAVLLTPGFFTDILGFLLVFPFTRKYIKGIVVRYIKSKTSSGDIEIHLNE